MDNSFITDCVTEKSTALTPVILNVQAEELRDKVYQFLTGHTDTPRVQDSQLLQLGQYCSCVNQKPSKSLRKAKQTRRMAGTRHLPYGQRNTAPRLEPRPGCPPTVRAPGRPPRWWTLISDYDFHAKQEITAMPLSSSPPKWWSLEADDCLYEDTEEKGKRNNVSAEDSVKDVQRESSESITQRQVCALEKLAMDMCRSLHLR